MTKTDPRASDSSVFPDPVYKETVLRPLFDGAKTHHVQGFRAIDRAHLVRHGATALRATPQGFAVTSARRPRSPEPPAEPRPAASAEGPASTAPPDPQDEPSTGEPGEEAP